ncbi:MAG: HNH endonuclease [Gammaproteobacteria bacterium]|nr:HNH endonuclease [Gammaproteobacteria bacterium]
METNTRDFGREHIDALDGAIVRLSARINAANYELLQLIRQFDERAGWLRWGFDNCVEWLAWRCDLGLSAAREKVRVAHALKTLPAVSASFASGTLSYSKVRAMTRVTHLVDEKELLAFALKTAASRVQERCRELRCGSEDSMRDANRAHAGRSLTVRRDAARGTMVFTLEVPMESGELIDRALDKARETQTSSAPEFAEQSWSALQADAMLQIASDFLAGNSSSATNSTSDNYQVTVHVDQSALEKGQGRAGLPVESVRRIACDSSVIRIVEDKDGEPLSVGRKTRIVPSAIKRALQARDRGCAFPGCHHKRFVDAHHVKHWSAGGETCLDNLLLLCSRHHRLVHEGGFTIEKDYRNRWFFRRPDGRAVPRCGYRAADMRDDVANENDSTNPSREGLLNKVEKNELRMRSQGP